MAVCRVEKTKNYTVMSNYHLNDPRLSLKAIGPLSKIPSLPEAWDYTVAGLAKICKEGRDAVRAAPGGTGRGGVYPPPADTGRDGQLFPQRVYHL